MYALPTDNGRWLQIAITKSTKIVWITAHTVNDGKKALQKLKEYGGEVSKLVLCIPGKFQRNVWGRPDFISLEPIREDLKHFKLEELHFRLESPTPLIGTLPDTLQGTELCLYSYSVQDEHVWKRFLDDIVARPLRAFTLSFYRSTTHMSDDGFLTAFEKHSLQGSVIEEFRVMDSSLDVEKAIKFLEHCKTRKINFVFDRTKFTGITSVDAVVRLLKAAENEFENALVSVSLEQAVGGKCQFAVDPCCQALAWNWSMTEATDSTKEMYLRILKTADGIFSPVFYLPRCSDVKCYENQEHCRIRLKLFLKALGVGFIKESVITPENMEYPKQIVIQIEED